MTDNNKHTNVPLKTALVGAAVGAAAVMLSRKEVRDGIRNNAKKILDTSEKNFNQAIKKAEQTTDKLAKQNGKTERKVQSV